MHPSTFIDQSTNPAAWRKHASALRHSAEVLWDDFTKILIECVASRPEGDVSNVAPAVEAFGVTKLLYGLTLETALKAWIVEHHPEKVELRVILNGRGDASEVELRTLGVPTSSGHNLLLLADVAGLFDETFADVVNTEEYKSALRNICRDLADVVTWRGRYPVPLASFKPIKLDPKAPAVALAHYMRDWLDPVLDVLLKTNSTS